MKKEREEKAEKLDKANKEFSEQLDQQIKAEEEKAEVKKEALNAM